MGTSASRKKQNLIHVIWMKVRFGRIGKLSSENLTANALRFTALQGDSAVLQGRHPAAYSVKL